LTVTEVIAVFVIVMLPSTAVPVTVIEYVPADVPPLSVPEDPHPLNTKESRHTTIGRTSHLLQFLIRLGRISNNTPAKARGSRERGAFSDEVVVVD
jgi:hypothetical protein